MIKDLQDIQKGEVSLFGGKATNLGFLIQNNFNVPPGFCISTEITTLTDDVKQEILAKFKNLTGNVSVRSSATAEDAKNASFAGQFDTILNVTEENLFRAIEQCWQSTTSERAQAYNKENTPIHMAVIVQQMIPADYAGVCFTVDPVEKKYVLIEIAEGLGEKLVSGEITPNSYFLSEKKVEKKNVQFDFDENILGNITTTAKEIEKTYGAPQDIEFCLKDGELFILQSRPITTL
ncbi:MAG: hypothetical protein OXR66_03495 [Candidatus Woesearchaeota archaeon]|nr:hypothetical protein [Candidatus Woesearchaeota archaeon]